MLQVDLIWLIFQRVVLNNNSVAATPVHRLRFNHLLVLAVQLKEKNVTTQHMEINSAILSAI